MSTLTEVTEQCPLPLCDWEYTSGAPTAHVDIVVATHLTLNHTPVEILHALKLAQGGVQIEVVRIDDDDPDFYYMD